MEMCFCVTINNIVIYTPRAIKRSQLIYDVADGLARRFVLEESKDLDGRWLAIN